MHLKNQVFKFSFCFSLILLFKLNFILTSIIVDRNKLTYSDLIDNSSLVDNSSSVNLSLINNSSLTNNFLLVYNLSSVEKRSSIDSSSFINFPFSSFPSVNSSSNNHSLVNFSTNSSFKANLSSTNLFSNNSSLNSLSSSNLSTINLNKIDNATFLKLEVKSILNNEQLNDSFTNLNLSTIYVVNEVPKNDFLEDQKKLIQNLVREENLFEDQTNLKIGITLTNLDEKPSTNSIINEELINQFKFKPMKNQSLDGEETIKYKEKLDQKIDEKSNETLNSNNQIYKEEYKPEIERTVDPALKLNHETEEVFDLKISESSDCIFVRSEEGAYNFYSNKNHTDTCALYLIAEPDKLIEFEFEKFNVSCGTFNFSYPKNNQSLINVVDGWEIKGEFFPGINDHLLKKTERYKEICLNDSKLDQNIIGRKFRVSQNVGLIQFRILSKFEGFKVRVRFIENPKPCNVVFRMPQGVYTLKNYGQPVNCSVSILFPESISIISNSIGIKPQPFMIDGSHEISKRPSNYYDYQLNKNQSQIDEELKSENNTIQSNLDSNDCLNNIENDNIHDYIELKGGNGLDTDLMLIADKLCFVKELKKKRVDIDCDNTAVRLVSSGLYDNSVTVAFDLLEASESGFKCPQKSFKG